MTGKIIAQKIEPRRSARLIQKKDGSAVCWVFFAGQHPKQTLLPVRKEEIEETIKSLGLQPVSSFPQ
jgi:hypothetical protein